MKKIVLLSMIIIILISCATKEMVMLDVPANTPKELADYSTNVRQSNMSNEEKSVWFYSIGKKSIPIADEMLNNLDLDNFDTEGYEAIQTALYNSYAGTTDRGLKKELEKRIEQVKALIKINSFGFSM